MKVTQIYDIMNSITKELLGETAVVNEDLSNIVELGTQFENVVGLDNYVRSLNDHIGRVVFVDRIYEGRVPSILMDGWEYGSILEKVTAKMPEATENESWELQDGASYDPNIFTKPTVSVKFYNSKVTFEIPMSFTEMQVKSSFSNATQLNAFMSMIYTAINNAMTLKTDSLIMRTLNTAIAETLFADYQGGDMTTSSGIRAVNLLYLFNQVFNQNLTARESITNANFIKFASYTMANYLDRIKVMSTLFNVGNTEKFTPQSRLHIVMLSEFKNAAGVYLNSDTFHDNYVALPNAETVPFWQGSGTGFKFVDNSSINVKTANNHTVNASGVLCVMFDRDALGVCNQNSRVTSSYNPKAEFWNEWHKWDSQYFVDTNENIIVFFVA